MELIITFDYELFGDGSGDIFEDVISPTNRILKICEREKIKATIFFEVLEYIKIKEEWESGNKMGYVKNPIAAIEAQLQKAHLNGHDIQLHIHPQWFNAKWENNKWILDFDNSVLPNFNDTNCSIFQLIQQSKLAVEDLIKKVDSNYKCKVFRAGYYNMMPSSEVIKSLKKLDIVLDSSIYTGGKENSTYANFDYSEVNNEDGFWWSSLSDIREKAKNDMGILEVPIFALPISRIYKLLNFDKIKSIFEMTRVKHSLVTKEKLTKKSTLQKIKFLFDTEYMPWDFCLFSNNLHKKYFNYIDKCLVDTRNVFVITGHPKGFKSERSLVSLIKHSKKQKRNYSFTTLSGFYDKIIKIKY